MQGRLTSGRISERSALKRQITELQQEVVDLQWLLARRPNPQQVAEFVQGIDVGFQGIGASMQLIIQNMRALNNHLGLGNQNQPQ